MISILIPTYNYSIIDLTEKLLSQLDRIEGNWEMLIQDDASTDKEIQSENKEYIEGLRRENVRYLILNENVGNAKNRNSLVAHSKGNWILFLDADVKPISSDFIQKYVDKRKTDEADIYTGNLRYKKSSISRFNLRYQYGKKYEETNLGKKVHSATTANFMAKRKVFEELSFLENLPNNYGQEDTLFFLEAVNFRRVPIDNPVFHLGWESNSIYLEKVKKSVENLLYIEAKNPNLKTEITLLRYKNKYPIFTKILGRIFPLMQPILERNLKGNYPKAELLQLFKWSYLAFVQRRNQS